jgi:fatty-acid desaturase
MAKAAEKRVEALDPHWDVIHIVNNHTDKLRYEREKMEETSKKIVQRKNNLRKRHLKKAANQIACFTSGVGFLGMTLCGFAGSYLLWGLFIAVSVVAHITVNLTTK